MSRWILAIVLAVTAFWGNQALNSVMSGSSHNGSVVTAFTQQGSDAAFRELAERLVSNASSGLIEGGASTARILPGEAPDGLPVSLPVVPGGRLVGSSSQRSDRGEIFQVVLDYQGTANQALDFYTSSLAEEGWTRPAQSGSPAGGFQQSAGLSGFFCQPGGNSYLTLSTRPLHEGVADVRVSVYSVGSFGLGNYTPCSIPSQAQYSSPTSILPPLRPPSGARFGSTGQSMGMGVTGSTAIVESSLSATDLEAHFTEDLQNGGWDRAEHGADGPSAWSTWSLPDRPDWYGILQVIELPGGDRRAASVLVFSSGSEPMFGPSTMIMMSPN